MSTTKISKSSLPFHPFILIIIPVLVLFRGNINQLYPEDLALPLLMVFIPIISLFLVTQNAGTSLPRFIPKPLAVQEND